LKNLDKYTEYFITVLIRNDKGEGPTGSGVTMRTLEDSKYWLFVF